MRYQNKTQPKRLAELCGTPKRGNGQTPLRDKKKLAVVGGGRAIAVRKWGAKGCTNIATLSNTPEQFGRRPVLSGCSAKIYGIIADVSVRTGKLIIPK